MIRHIFIGTFKENVDNAIKKKILVDLRAMREKIPNIIALEANFSTGWVDSDNSVVMTVDFATKEDFDEYIAHPYHTDHVAKQGAEFLSSYVAAQFEL